jgi:HlyD family secretion protein
MKKAALALALFVAACSERQAERWLGYIEGEPALIAAPQPGWVTALHVARGSEVRIGTPLFTLDSPREIAARDSATAAIAGAKAQQDQAREQVAQAAARRAEADAEIVVAQRELQRQQDLVRIGGTPQRDVERARAALESARAARRQIDAQARAAQAQIEQAEAQERQAQAGLATAQTNLSERGIESRVAGQVQEIYFRQGEYVPAGVPVVSVLAPQNVFVRFFIPEAQLASVRLGDPVRITCDGCPDDLTARITFIAKQAEFTPPVIYSVENRERLVFKAEARAPGLALRPGLPVEIAPLPR